MESGDDLDGGMKPKPNRLKTIRALGSPKPQSSLGFLDPVPDPEQPFKRARYLRVDGLDSPCPGFRNQLYNSKIYNFFKGPIIIKSEFISKNPILQDSLILYHSTSCTSKESCEHCPKLGILIRNKYFNLLKKETKLEHKEEERRTEERNNISKIILENEEFKKKEEKESEFIKLCRYFELKKNHKQILLIIMLSNLMLFSSTFVESFFFLFLFEQIQYLIRQYSKGSTVLIMMKFMCGRFRSF